MTRSPCDEPTTPLQANAPVTFGFGKNRRLLKRADFLHVYQHGKKAYGRHVTVFGLKRDASQDTARGEKAVLPESDCRVGITATKKTGRATKRNRQRRLVRTYFRLNQSWLPEGWDFIVNTRGSLSSANYEELREDLDRTLAKLGFRAPRAKSGSRER